MNILGLTHSEHLRLSYSKQIDSLSVQSFCLQGQIFPGLKGDIIILKCRPIKEKKNPRKLCHSFCMASNMHLHLPPRPHCYK